MPCENRTVTRYFRNLAVFSYYIMCADHHMSMLNWLKQQLQAEAEQDDLDQLECTDLVHK